MPNLVGIGNSQVPTNAMLGGLAYQNSNNVSIQKGELGDIAEIRAKLNINPISYNNFRNKYFPGFFREQFFLKICFSLI